MAAIEGLALLQCKSCGAPTLHDEAGGVVFCTICSRHYEQPKKGATLFTCSLCGDRTLVFAQRGKIVQLPAKSCFRPDRRVVHEVEYQCDACVDPDAPEAA